ncbi:MAG: AAA family ATPase [Chitinophagales bacterium]
MENNEGIYIIELQLENVRCFGEKAVLDLSDGNGSWRRWNVILGDNGIGKTTLLQILSMLEHRPAHERFIGEPEVTQYVPLLILDSDILFSFSKISASKEKLAIVAKTIPRNPSVKSLYDIIVTIPHENEAGSTSSNLVFKQLIFYGYGADRRIGHSFLSESFSTINSRSLFEDNAELINAEEWLLQLDYSSSKESEVRDFATAKKEQVTSILLDLLPDLSDIRFSIPTKEKLVPTVQFQTPFGWVNINQLSLGYKTMVAWMVDLAAKLFDRYPDSDNPLSEPAIVLVDEIDLHLHPKWQRKIFGYLSEKFPKTQFIVTAHSPLVVQAAPEDANIILLRKEGDHVVIDQSIESVHQWRLDQILTSELFGLETAYNPQTEKLIDERKELLSKNSLTIEEKKRLGELNSIVENLPTGENDQDREAMNIIRSAANYLKSNELAHK